MTTTDKRYVGDTASTNSVLTVPVYGNNSGEPCYNATFANAWCQQGYRWNLDYVVDPSGNSMTYFYTQFSGYYGRNGNTGVAPYDIAGTLDHVDYGTRAGSEASAAAPMQVWFVKSNRCTGSCVQNTSDYPDTPWDLYCSSTSSCPSLLNPVFFNRYKLSSVYTQVRDASSGQYRKGDQWDLTHTYPATGDHIDPVGNDTAPNLWLQTLTHTGYAVDGTTTLAEPTITFGGTAMYNRVFWGNDIGVAPYVHYRLTSIANGMGGQTLVSYSGADCDETFVPTSDSNPYRCFPQYFTPQLAPPGWGWFHKYVTNSVTERDLTGGSPDEVLTYTYSTDGTSDPALWSHDYSEAAMLGQRSWSLWRGYPTVTETKGASGGTQTVTRQLYYRGMDGDALSSGVNTKSWGSRRAGVTTPITTPGASGAVSGLTAKCLDISAYGIVDGTNVQMYTCTGAWNQVWQRKFDSNDQPILVNPQSGKCLDLAGWGTTNGTNVQLWTCTGATNQVWQREPNGTYKNPVSGKCLDMANWGTTNGTNVQLSTCTANWNQRWQPQHSGALANRQTARCIDISAFGTTDGTKIQTWHCTGATNQVWQPQPNGTLRNPGSGKCLDIANYGTANGSLVHLWTCTGASNQIWQPQPDGTLKNPNSGRCLEAGSAPSNGTQLQIYDCTGSITQTWTHNLTDSTGTEGFLREETNLDGTTVVDSTINTPTVTQTGLRVKPDGQDITARMVTTTNTRTRTWLAATTTWRWTETQTSYDSYGLPTGVKDLGDTANSDDDTCTHTDYARNTSSGKYLVDFLSQAITTTCAATPADADYLSGSQVYYDGSTTLGAAPTEGLATKTNGLAAVTSGAMTWKQNSRTDYDSNARVIGSYDALDRKNSTTYAPASGGPITSVTVTNPANHQATVNLNNRGKPVTSVDANGKTTTGEYDPLGRLAKVWLPGQPINQAPNTEYVYNLSGSASNYRQTKTLGPNGNQIPSYEIYDGLLRLRQTQTTAPDGKRAITDTQYNDRGLTAKNSTFYNNASGPTGALVSFADASVPTQQRLAYDGLERQTIDALWSLGTLKWQTTTSHDGDRVTISPPDGATPTTTILDALGRKTTLRQYTGTTPTGSYDESRYSYDRLDRLTGTTDAAGNAWSYGYDLLGQQTTKVDPDAGTTTSTYDDAGQLITTTDGRGKALARVYDDLGRLTELHDNTTSGPLRVSYIYDTLAKGRLTSSTRHVGADAYTTTVTGYTDRYAPTGTTITIPTAEGNLAGVYTTASTYNPDGSTATTGLPSLGGLPAETLTHSYSNVGLPTALTGASSYVASTDYTWDATVSRRLLGTAGKQVRLTDTRDQATRRLTTRQVDTENQTTPGTFDDKSTSEYGYDQAGNITAIAGKTNGTRDQVECFRYDYLRRLTDAWTEADWTCQTTQRTGADPYRLSWTYDTTGNRRTQTSHSPTGTTTGTYSYPAAGGPTPHRLTQVAYTGETTRTDGYDYDNAGNTTTRTVNGATQTLTWDPEGHLATTTANGQNTSYVYDPAGNRLIRRDSTGTTLYLGDTELRLTTTNGQIDGTRYYQHGDTTVAVRTILGLTWLTADHHGTNQHAIDPTTLTATRRRSMPFGEPRGTQPTTWPGEKGFVDGTQDPTGLTHLGAREYDPSVGRFISVDPIMDLADPQQWNAYSYASNSPATLSDPSGLIPADCREFDCYGYDPRPLKKGDGRGAGGCPGGCGTKKNTAWGKKNKKSTTKSKKNIHPTVVKAGPAPKAEEEPSGGGVPVRQAAWCAVMAGANCALGWALSELAIARADNLKDRFGWARGERNAFRHSFWMALMTAHGFSIDEALAFGRAHERDGDTPGQMWGSEDSNTDLHNNEVGARIGAKVHSKLTYVAPVAAYRKIEARLLAMLDGYDPSTGPYTRSTRDGNLRLIPPK